MKKKKKILGITFLFLKGHKLEEWSYKLQQFRCRTDLVSRKYAMSNKLSSVIIPQLIDYVQS